jgi:hypothetical protein
MRWNEGPLPRDVKGAIKKGPLPIHSVAWRLEWLIILVRRTHFCCCVALVPLLRPHPPFPDVTTRAKRPFCRLTGLDCRHLGDKG